MQVQEYEADARTFQNINMEDGKLYAVFFKDVVKDEGQSEEMGRPIFRDTEFVRIVAPGDKTNVVVRPARTDDKQRFARQYEAFKRGDAEQIVGTPLAQWPLMTRAQVEEFRYFGVLTVEHLASLRDDVKMKMPGALDLSKRASAWLEASNGVGNKLAESDARASEQAARITALEELVHKLTAGQPAALAVEDADDEEEYETPVVPPMPSKGKK